ncbi:MAG: sigma-70 family RNA polymerase sigma factor [Enterocloster aldenensis]
MSNEPQRNHGEMTNEQLVIRIKAGEDVAGNMERLYNQVQRFIHAIAWKYRDSGELEDLEQEGYLALYPAIDGYDPAQGVKFLTYAEYHIRQRMQRYLQMNGSCLRLPVHCLEKVQQYKRLCNAFNREYGREPSDRESAALLGFSLEQIGNIRKSACMDRLGSLDAPVKGLDGGEDATVGELVASAEDVEGDALEQMEQEQLKAELWDCVDGLPGQQPAVLRKRYKDGMTLGAIGQECGTTPEAVRQIHNKALRELRKPRYARRLRPFLPESDRIFSMAITGNGVDRFNLTWTSSTERAALDAMDWEERRQEHLELLERVRQSVAKSQQNMA